MLSVLADLGTFLVLAVLVIALLFLVHWSLDHLED